MNVKDQIITPDYAIYNGDCVDVVSSLADNSVDLSVYSPPFCGLYNYSSDHRDMSNCETREQFLAQYEYLVDQIARVTSFSQTAVASSTRGNIVSRTRR